MSVVFEGEKGQPEAIPTCSGKAAWGTQAKALTRQGERLAAPGAGLAGPRIRTSTGNQLSLPCTESSSFWR